MGKIYTLISASFFIVLFLFPTPADAQRGLQCGQACNPSLDNCVSNSFCHPATNTCYQLGCDPNRGDPACCRSIRPTVPPQQPTIGNPNVPGPGQPNVTQPPVDANPTIRQPGPTSDPRRPQPPVGAGADCSGPTEGQPDGNVDLLDFNLLRKGFSGASTIGCDVNGNGTVLNDLEDFNLFRLAFAR